jgi:protein-S-isoprenylcysteine O-methyltransferase Ste14
MNSYFIMLLVTVAYWISFEIYLIFFRENGNAFKVDSNNTVAYFSFVAVALLIIGISNSFQAAYIVMNKNIHFLGGVIIMWLGIILRLWAVGSLGNKFSTLINVNNVKEIIKVGPYKVIRHPSYTGALIAFIGLSFAIGNSLSVLATTIVISLAYYQRINSEEKYLLSNLGTSYFEYMQTTKRLIPYIY